MSAAIDGDASLFDFVPNLAPHDIPSEYARPNQILFRDAHAYRPVGGNLPGLAGITYDGERHFLPMFDVAEADPVELDALIRDWGCLYPVWAEMAGRLVRRGLVIDHRRADSDNVYAAGAFETYAGRALHPKRNLLNQFVTQAVPRSADLAGREDAARAVLDGWLADVDKSPADSDFGPCRQGISQLGALGLTGRIAFTGAGKPVGFVIASRLGSDCAVIHFAKGRRAFNGVYPFLFSDFVRHNPGIRWLNFEQDLGNPGFRQNKQSFDPHHMITKYRVRRGPAAQR